MANPNTPAGAGGSVPPPVFQLPFGEIRGDGKVYPTIPFLNFMQTLWASIAGSGGIIDISGLVMNAPQYRDVSPNAIYWEPTIAGSTTAGAQTYASQCGWACNVGPMTFALFSVTLSDLDAATAGDVTIAGLPVAAASVPGLAQPGYVSSYADVVQTTGLTQIGVEAAAGANALTVRQSSAEWAGQPLPATGLTATSSFVGGCTFFH